MRDTHEDLRRSAPIETSSNRSFGVVFAVVFALIALWPLLSARPPLNWALAAALVMVLLAWRWPDVLAWPNRQWTRLGLLLGRIVSPLVLGGMFYVVITPFAVVMRLAGRDALARKRDPEAKTYWIERDPPGPPPDSMRNQF